MSKISYIQCIVCLAAVYSLIFCIARILNNRGKSIFAYFSGNFTIIFLSSLRRRVFLSVIAVVLFYLLDAQAFDFGFNTTLKARSQIANHLKKRRGVACVRVRVF